MSDKLGSSKYREITKEVNFCPVVNSRVESLADYLSVFESLYKDPSAQFWFRGHDSIKWDLKPSALRFESTIKIEKALGSLGEFRRIQEYRIEKPPRYDETFKWMQLAQHYGLPTKLLDWTQSPVTALYFACLDKAEDGMVFAMNPQDLTRLSGRTRKTTIIDPEEDAEILSDYISIGPVMSKKRLKTLAVKPSWNSERIILQQGMFTIHETFPRLDQKQVPSLIGVPILSSYKSSLSQQLERIGISEMSIFPEPEHVCNHLKRHVEL